MNDPLARFSLKDHLFNRERVSYLAGLFQRADSSFDAQAFIEETVSSIASLELKQRISQIAVSLEEFLDPDFGTSARQLVAALPMPLDPTKTDDDFGDFIFAPLGEFVVRNGLTEQHLSRALQTLQELTQRFSMEYAIRPFIAAFPERTLTELKAWSTHPHYHVRRLVSEGTRPRLPWASRLALEPSVAICLLNNLHADSTRYVTRSVANHLNDISKSQPELVLQTLTRWQQTGQQTQAELRWMSRHALRTLVKRGHLPAFQFLGFDTRPQIEIVSLKLMPEQLTPGQAFELTLTLKALKAGNLVIDYEIDFAKAGGRRSKKIYRLKQLQLAHGQSITLRKLHPLRAKATTYTLYPGTHRVTVQINGEALQQLSFELLQSV